MFKMIVANLLEEFEKERKLKDSSQEKCLIDSFFAHEAKKPVHKRVNYCHISCPCSKCNPRFM